MYRELKCTKHNKITNNKFQCLGLRAHCCIDRIYIGCYFIPAPYQHYSNTSQAWFKYRESRTAKKINTYTDITVRKSCVVIPNKLCN